METINDARLYDYYIESRQIRRMFSGELPRFLLLHVRKLLLYSNPGLRM